MPGPLPLSGATSVYYKQFLFLLDIPAQVYNKTGERKEHLHRGS